MTAVTVLIPTHDRAQTLRLAIASVQRQTVQDFELLIVGDGVSDETREVVAESAAADSRIKFFDFEKVPGQGELNRHRALQNARGEIIAYHGDDDCWMPQHLEVLTGLLREADFGHTLQVGIDRDCEIVVMPADLENPEFRKRMIGELFNRFDFTFAGHTRAAYHRLPYGWRTTPSDGVWTDLHMWRQFLSEPWCRVRSAMIPTGVNTWSHRRPDLSDAERAKDLAYWSARAQDPRFREMIWHKATQTFARESVSFEIEHVKAQSALVKAERGLSETDTALRAITVDFHKDQRSLSAAHHRAEEAERSLANTTRRAEEAERSLADTTRRAEEAELSLKDAVGRAEEAEAISSSLRASLTTITSLRSWKLMQPLRRLRAIIIQLRSKNG